MTQLNVDAFPDSVAVVRAALVDSSELGAITERVSTAVPARPVFPHLTIHRIGGVPAVPVRLDSAHIQVSAWGTSEAEASLLARTARAVLHRLRNASYAGAVITGVDDTLGLSWQPDAVRTPPTPRFVFGVMVHLHAA